MNDVFEVESCKTTSRERRAYRSPRLSLLGNVGSLTETGSMVGMEDGSQNAMCSPIIAPVNMTFNMC